jgi:hypothetical protein
MANYAFTTMKKLPEVKDGHTFTSDNFCQAQPHTKIFEGVKGLTFIDCELTNCDIPEDAKCIGCAPRHAKFCSHLHPKWVEKGVLPQCEDSCEHMVSLENVEIAGETKTIQTYSDKAG